MDKPIYLDYAAATPVDPGVLLSMNKYLVKEFYNPSAVYLASKRIAKDIANARESVAFWLGAKPSEIIFTAGGTESNNLAIHGIMRQYPDANMVYSAIEHDAVRLPARHYSSTEVPVSKDGTVDIDSLCTRIDEKTVLVSAMYANNEIGTIQPLKEIAKRLQEIRRSRSNNGNKLPLLLHTDACQAANYLDLHVARLGVDLMTLNGGKIYGPKQSGCLFVRTGITLQPLIDGGGQENGKRSGTENVASIIGFAHALDVAQRMRGEEVKRLNTLRDMCINTITSQFPKATINGSMKKRLPNNISVTFPGVDNERLVMQLDEQGIMCAVGSACSASKEESSHVLKAIGLSDVNARSTLRFTLGRGTTEKDIAKLVATLKELLRG